MNGRRQYGLWRRIFPAIFPLLSLTGCISANVDESPPDFATVVALRSRLVRPVATGPFSLASPAVGKPINIRGSTMHPPKGESFADVLGHALDGQLKAAGRFDTAAPVRISGILTDSGAGENIAHGHSALGVDIVVNRAGVQVFARHYSVDARWDSSFIGAIAIPDAFLQYNALYDELSRKILNDPDLVGAINGS